MSNGQIIDLSFNAMTAVLLDAQVSSSSGVWISGWSVHEKTFVVLGLEAGGSIAIHVHGQFTKPDDAVSGAIIQTIMANNAVVDRNRFRWIKAVKVSGGTPTATSVFMNGEMNG